MKIASTPQEEKRLATALAKLCLVGVIAHRMEDDAGREVVLVTKWAMTRELSSLQEVEAWVARVTGDSLRTPA